MELYLIEGCGVGVVCEKGQSMLGWIDYIIKNGGVPTIQRIVREESRAA